MNARSALFGIPIFISALLCNGVLAETFPMQAKGAKGQPDEVVFVELVYDYGTGFGAIVEDFEVQYPHAALAFLPESSIIDMGGTDQNFPQYVDMLRSFAQDHFGSVLENSDPILSRADRKGYTISFYTADGTPHMRSGEVHLNAAFQILPTTAPGDYQVSFGEKNVLVNELEVAFSYPSTLQNLVVTVVPEPAIALMLVPGLGVVTWYARRRTSRGVALPIAP